MKHKNSQNIIKTYMINQQNEIINSSALSYQQAHEILKSFTMFMEQYYIYRKNITHFVPSKIYKNINYNTVIYYLATGKLKNKSLSKIIIGNHHGRYYVYQLPKECYSFLLIEDLYKKMCNHFNICPDFSRNITPKNKRTNQHKNNNTIITYPSRPSGSFVNVLVYSTTLFKCRNPKHQIVDVNIIVPVKRPNGEEVEIRVSGGYCPNCGTYFITTNDYKRLKQQGRITCRVMESKRYYEDSEYSFLQSESIIFQYGYNVKQSEGLSSKERQAILKTVISDGVLSNHEIRTHLEWLIRSNKGRQDRDLAISKWQEDLAFLRNYKAESNPNYKAASIKHIHYEPK